MPPSPYSQSPQFNQDSLPDAIRNAHNTKAGVWGLLVVTQGEVRLVFHDPARELKVMPGRPAVIPPEAVHHVETSGAMTMHVEFYREPPPAGEG